MLTALVVLAVLGILFGAAALATYDGELLADPHPDDAGVELPATALQPEDVAEVRFDMALRGYRMAEVDGVLARLAAELAARDNRIQQLEQALVSVAEPPPAVASAPAVASTPADSVPPVVASAPAEVLHEAPERTQPQVPVVASAPAEVLDEAPERTQEPEPTPAPEPPAFASPVLEEPVVAPEVSPPPVASAPAEVLHEAPERTQAPEPPATPEPERAPEPPAAVSGPLTATTWWEENAPELVTDPGPPAEDVPSPPAELTLPAADDAFSFPELHLPDAAPEGAPEAAEDSSGEDEPRP